MLGYGRAVRSVVCEVVSEGGEFADRGHRSVRRLTLKPNGVPQYTVWPMFVRSPAIDRRCDSGLHVLRLREGCAL